MDDLLNDSDMDVIVDSLNHYKAHIENYSGYSSYEFKQQQLARVESAIQKVRALQKSSSTQDVKV